MPGSIERLNAALADRYRIERELGQGGMATVYLAQDLKHDRRVALKVLKPELAAVLGAERFLVEIKTTASMSHPHILPLFDSGSADGFLFYVMPFIEGETLRGKLDRETQLGIDEAVRIAREVLDALEYAHSRGVIHRDIKPENILLQGGRPMVADFGIALAVSAAAGGRMTETGLSLGTPHYMSPEQATAAKEITGRSDVYSLGSVLFEMLTGNPPHVGSSAQQIIMRIITEPAQEVTAFRKSVPRNVADAVATSLEKLPADRFASAREFAVALGASGYERAATGVGPAAGAVRRDWRSRVAVPALAAAALLLAVVVWGALRPAPALRVARHEVAVRGSGGSDFVNFAVSADGSHFVTVRTEGAGRRLYVRRREQLDAVALVGTEGATIPAISPSGDRVAFMVDGSIRIVDLAGGPVTVLTDSLVGVPGLAWGPDGYIYFDRRGIGPLMRIREAGGVPEAASAIDTASGELQHVWPDVLPNGRGVVMSVNRGGPGQGAFETDGIAVLDLRTGRHRELFRGVFARYAASGHLLFVTREGQLMAAPFDQDRLEVTGTPVAFEQGIGVRTNGSGAVELAITRDGELWYTAGGQGVARREIVWATRDGRIERPDPAIEGNITDAALSPDGARVAYILRGGGVPTVWVSRLGSGTRDRLTFERSFDAVTWHPDGRSLLVNELRGEVLRVPADASALPSPVPGLRRDITDVRWSPDGAWIVFTAVTGNNSDVHGFRPGVDSAAVPLIATADMQRAPAVSPDGKWILFHSSRTGIGEVFVRPFPNTSGSLRQVSASIAREPRWSRDGREIFYRTYNDTLYAVPVLPGPSFALGAPRALFPVAGVVHWDVSPDGRRFMLLRTSDSEAERQLIVVENFFEELRAATRPKR